MAGGGGDESSDDDPEVPSPVGISPADEGAAEWIANEEKILSAVQTTAFEVAKLRTDLGWTVGCLAGDENSFFNEFWGAQVSEREQELRAKEAAIAAAHDKSEKERQAKAAAEQADLDMVESERILLEAQRACEAQKLKVEAAQKHAERLAEESDEAN